MGDAPKHWCLQSAQMAAEWQCQQVWELSGHKSVPHVEFVFTGTCWEELYSEIPGAFSVWGEEEDSSASLLSPDRMPGTQPLGPFTSTGSSVVLQTAFVAALVKTRT